MRYDCEPVTYPPLDEQREFYEWASLQQAIEDVAAAARRDPEVMKRLEAALKKEKVQ